MIYVLFGDGFEEVEALSVVDMARRADIDVKMVSLNQDLYVTGAHNIKIMCDIMADEMTDADGVVLPGGIPGVYNIEKNKTAMVLIKDFIKRGKMVAAICAAPTILAKQGLLDNVNAVCYPTMLDMLDGANVTDKNVVTHNNIITSKSAGTALDFAFEIIKYLKSDEMANNVKKSIYYK